MIIGISPNRTAITINPKGLKFIKLQGFLDRSSKILFHAIYQKQT